MTSILAAGLLPRLVAGGAVALLIAVAAALAERQMEVWSRGRQISALGQDLEREQQKAEQLAQRNTALDAANTALAAAAETCRRAVDEATTQAEQRAQASRRLLAAQARAGAEDRATADWLGGLVQQQAAQLAAGQAAHDACPAGTALREIRGRWQ